MIKIISYLIADLKEKKSCSLEIADALTKSYPVDVGVQEVVLRSLFFTRATIMIDFMT